ncbi:MAG: hypothetical protein MHM6MM_006794 [Cercozoa sp. M6MM]
MSWADYTNNLAAQGFTGACIIDRNSYQVLAQAGDMIPRAYQADGQDINENVYLAQDWSTELTSIRFNCKKFMVLRKGDDFATGKKGKEFIFLYKLKSIYLVAMGTSDTLPFEQGQVAIGKMFDALAQAGC